MTEVILEELTSFPQRECIGLAYSHRKVSPRLASLLQHASLPHQGQRIWTCFLDVNFSLLCNMLLDYKILFDVVEVTTPR